MSRKSTDFGGFSCIAIFYLSNFCWIYSICDIDGSLETDSQQIKCSKNSLEWGGSDVTYWCVWEAGREGQVKQTGSPSHCRRKLLLSKVLLIQAIEITVGFFLFILSCICSLAFLKIPAAREKQLRTRTAKIWIKSPSAPVTQSSPKAIFHLIWKTLSALINLL